VRDLADEPHAVTLTGCGLGHLRSVGLPWHVRRRRVPAPSRDGDALDIRTPVDLMRRAGDELAGALPDSGRCADDRRVAAALRRWSEFRRG
jgi:hypothetical protein